MEIDVFVQSTVAHDPARTGSFRRPQAEKGYLCPAWNSPENNQVGVKVCPEALPETFSPTLRCAVHGEDSKQPETRR